MEWRIDFGERDWHPWWAWYPVRLQGTDTKIWLDWVERKTMNAQGYLCSSYRRRGLDGV